MGSNCGIRRRLNEWTYFWDIAGIETSIIEYNSIMTIIYALIDPRNKQVRYIGQTIQKLPRRVQGHLYRNDHNPHKVAWLNQLRSLGLKPIAEVLEEVDDIVADEKEQYYIAKYRNFGDWLLNADSGGRQNREISDETRKLMSAKSRGRQQSESTKAKRSASLLGREVTDAMKKALASGRVKGIKRSSASEERKHKISLANRGNGELSPDQIREIRERCNKESRKSIAELFGVSVSLIHKIVQRQRYDWVE